MLLQKLLGVALVLISLATLPLEHDATAAVLLVPLGAWLIVSKRNLLY